MKRQLLAFILGVFTLPVVIGAAALFGFLPVSANEKPPMWEINLAQSVLNARIKRDAEALKNPMPADENTLLRGMRLFRENCAGCHGDVGQPSYWGTNNFYPRVPQFADHPPRLQAREMFQVVKYGVRYSAMGGWNGMLPDADIWNVVMFLNRLDSLPPSVETAWKKKK